MTDGTPSGTVPWYGRPRLLTMLVVGLLVAAALLTPEKAGRPGVERRITTRSTEPGGASLLPELARALGWQASDNATAEFPRGPRIIHAVLDPATPLRAPEVHALLQRVREGAGLLVIVGNGPDVLRDSLRLSRGRTARRPPRLSDHCTPADARPFGASWIPDADDVASVGGVGTRVGTVDTLFAAQPALGKDTTGRIPVAVGFAVGRGRVVAFATSGPFRNDVLRRCAAGFSIPYVRALEYLRDSGAVLPRDRVVFDEYHQGHGIQPGTIRAVATYFAETTSGHVVAQWALAGLLLLAARSGRLVPPAPDVADERRSPLEHVDALARAYAQVGATRTATQRLVRGVRRRTATAATGGASVADDAWLAMVAARVPARAADVARVRAALGGGVSAGPLVDVAAALAAIEDSLSDPRLDPRPDPR